MTVRAVGGGGGVVADALSKCVGGELVTVVEGPIGDVPFTPSRDELVVMRTAVPKRRQEFYTGRYYVALAASSLGLARPALMPDECGAPQWPPAVVGSISHCDTWAAAALTTSPFVASIGIDVEPAGPLPPGVGEIIASAQERYGLGELPDDVFPDRLLFCAKEAVFKAWYPLTGLWLDFDDIEVRLADNGTWVAWGGRGILRVDWEGAWSARGGLLAAAVVAPRTPFEGSAPRP